MGHRVAITGIGAVSPNGIGREAFWEATKAGVSGVRAIRSFDPADLLVRIAGEIPDFDDEITANTDIRHDGFGVAAGINGAAGQYDA